MDRHVITTGKLLDDTTTSVTGTPAQTSSVEPADDGIPAALPISAGTAVSETCGLTASARSGDNKWDKKWSLLLDNLGGTDGLATSATEDRLLSDGLAGRLVS